MSSMELWAGLECTRNRIGDRFVDQCEKNGHVTRLDDLKKFAELNVKRIRYPFLWEKICPDTSEACVWGWSDERLAEMRKLGIEPIAGFVHHGSGPQYTSLLDPQFPDMLANFASKFADRYPWVKDYTPINEILTTAAFSCLYGHWYPHHKSDQSFVFAVFNQVKATILCMQEIRKIQPNARLIQTEDLGRAQATETLQYQADFQNQRRWLSFDMLCGRIDKKHPLYDYLKRSGLTDQQMKWLKTNACPPDILGVNHYLLSSRFLDHRLEKYPVWSHGGNGIHAYADVGAVDTLEVATPTPESIFEEVWARYQLPIAITEVHVCGHRESQLRWLEQIWSECERLTQKGVDIRAVTAWSLLGSFDWHRLCTVDEGFYESGVFDLRSKDGSPKETIVSQWMKSLSQGKKFSHPVLEQKGWWQEKGLAFKPVGSRKILITGGRGTLAQAFAKMCELRRIPFTLVHRSVLDITDAQQVNQVLNEVQPWAVINGAGYVKVDEAENERLKCYQENVEGAKNLAIWCAKRGVPFVTFSSDLVFDGNTELPYSESAGVSPLNTYGHSKVQCEKNVLEVHPDAMVIRTSSFFGPWDRANFITQTLQQLSQKQKVIAADDLWISPTYVPDLVNATLDLLIDGEKGLLHLTNEGALSWADFARMAIEEGRRHLSVSFDESLLIGTHQNELRYQARRPRNSTLTSDRFRILPSVENALGRYFSQLEVPLH